MSNGSKDSDKAEERALTKNINIWVTDRTGDVRGWARDVARYLVCYGRPRRKELGPGLYRGDSEKRDVVLVLWGCTYQSYNFKSTITIRQTTNTTATDHVADRTNRILLTRQQMYF